MLEPSTIIGIISFLTLVVGGVIVLKSKIPKETITNYQSAIASFEARTKTQENDLTMLKGKIIKLEARLDVVETMPLQQLSSDYHIVSDTLNFMATTLREVIATNKQILTNQVTTADLLANDNRKRAKAVKQVKVDLKQDDKNLERKVKAKVE